MQFIELTKNYSIKITSEAVRYKEIALAGHLEAI